MQEPTLQDITQIYQTIVDKSKDWIFLLDDFQKIFFTTPSCEAITGYPIHWFEQDPELLFRIVHKEDLDDYRENIKKQASPKDICNFVYRITTKAGEQRWLEAECQDIHNSNGARIAKKISNRDITERKLAEIRIVESEQKYRSLVENSPYPVLIIHSNKIVFANKSAYAFFGGKGKSEIIEKKYLDFIVEEDRDKHYRRIHRLKKEKPILKSEVRFLTLDQSLRYAEVTTNFVESNGHTTYIALINDITQKKNAEEKTRNQLYFSNCMNQLAETVIKDNQADKIRHTLSKEVGLALQSDISLIFRVALDKQAIENLSVWIKSDNYEEQLHLHNYHYQQFRHCIKEVQSTRGPIISYRDKPHGSIKKDALFDLLHLDYGINSFLWFPFAFNENDFLVFVLMHFDEEHHWTAEETHFLEDATQLVSFALQKINFLNERIESELQLQQSKEKYQTLYDHNPSMFFTMDQQFIIQSVNQFGANALGYSKEELHGTSFLSLFADSDREIALEKLLEAWQAVDTITNREFRKNKRDGSEIWVNETFRFIKDEKGENLIFASSYDITERKNAEKAKDTAEKEKDQLQKQLFQSQKMEAIGTLAGGIAHDFNNLLTLISGHAEMVAITAGKDNKFQDAIDAIYLSAEKAQKLTRQLLTFSRKQVVNLQTIDINSLILNLMQMLERLIGEDIRIELFINEQFIAVKADASQLEQVIINLVVNARDAIAERPNANKEKKIVIRTAERYITSEEAKNTPLHKSGKFAMIEISDTGCGIPSDIQEKIFDPFFTTKSVGKGTGLGLSTVYGIVNQNDGFIDLKSKAMKGTSFFIHWPISPDIPVFPEKYRRDAELEKGYEFILVVEDNHEIRRFLKNTLTSLGYKVELAQNGVDAIENIEKNDLKPDLLLSDIVMPKMNGKELSEKYQKMFPNAPVLLTSGYASDPSIMQDKPEERYFFIQKPFSIKGLSIKIRDILEGRV
jgi:PAS domain S-box-containing protein